MIRFAAVTVVALFIALTACKSSNDTSTSDSTDNGSTRSVTCGKSKCTNDDFCCGSPGFADANCSVVCSSPQGSIYCDDASDCPTDAVCCYFGTGGNVSGSACLNECPTSDGHGQLCTAGSTECVGKACKALAAAPSGLFSCQ